MRLIFLLIICLSSFNVLANVQTDFSYNGAREAFNNDGRTPSANEVAGEWVWVGSVCSDDKKPVYSADGWFNYSKANGQYRTVSKFQPNGVDPFGRAHFISVQQLFDRDSEKFTLHYLPDLKWTLGRDLLSVPYAPGRKGNGIVCGITIECRVLNSNNMLLCDTRMTGQKFCTGQPEAHTYDGYIRLQP